MINHQDSSKIIDILCEKIIKASEDYYLGTQSISDHEFDGIVENLKILDPDNPILTKVGWGLSVYKDKFKLPAPIRHSLDKVSGIENLDPEKRYRCSLKIDGMTCILQYKLGKLVLAVTRGDGIYGINITPKIDRIQGVLLALSVPIDAIIRGELFISLPEFEENLSETDMNPRASTSGIIGRKSFNGLEHIRFVGHPESFRGIDLQNNDFLVVPEIYLKPEQIEECYKNNTFYPTDGMVCSDDNYDNIFAFKFKTEVVETKVIDVKYNIKKGGKLVPTIYYMPVKLYGTICKKCSGFNLEYIKNNNIGPGTTIELTKANEIIPYITRIIKGTSAKLPQESFRIDGVHAYVEEDIQYELSLKHFVGHHFCFDGFKRPEVIVDALGINSFSDLAKWRNPIMQSGIIDRLSAKGVKKIAPKIADKLTEGDLNEKDMFRQFAFDGMGTKASEALQPFIEYYYDMLSDFNTENTMEELFHRSGVNVTVRNILLSPEFQTIFSQARSEFEWYFKDDAPKVSSGEIKATFIITGGLPSGRTKKAFSEFVAPYGYKMVTTSKQAAIVIGSPTSKTAKAKYAIKNDLPLMTEDQFIEKYLEI